ncbi:MAG TPA: CaiB/BaiF CoA-transferase family protein [Aggregatilinea sp.]|uniref:CaiB/BaiF CoA transferase family protein n=1 Tax=Aggregatilinea sp. TaxID=2806333 RepID=UPI002BF07FC7|nr:CaiB/BaiF CoA-transferase family protein [Aggregatilinea sp.]HML20524.1 CaiB/BaiF CoA-transferase family protein [Aggregatilinea sp.]
MGQPGNAALNGVRVLDFSRVLAGPFCTMILGDLGADVIKIERPGTGDDTRAWGPPWSGYGADAQSAYFLCANRNKRSLTLNLKSDIGRDLARRLAAQSQIVVENFMPGQMAGYGLGFEDLREQNPAVVYCSITGFGQAGPYHNRPGYDYVIQAMSGLMSITGPVEGDPVKVGVAISDVLAGLFAATSILAALRHAGATGEGQHIDISLLDSQIAALVNVASNTLVDGKEPRRYGNQHPNIVPYQTFRAADGEFVLAVGNDGQFAKLCEIIGRPDLVIDPRFATNPARVEHRDRLISELDTVFGLLPVQTWARVFVEAGIPAGPINSIPAALDDPHVQARDLIHTADDGTRSIGSPLKLSATPPSIRREPPHLGEHTVEVLRDVLGLDDAAIAACREAGAV